MPTVVEYATGRYELRGDGVTTAHVWAWVPNPPPAPPPAPSQALDAPATDGQGGAPSKIYRWTDEQGVTYLTNRVDDVPASQRSSTRQGAPAARPRSPR
jgi:hypothetical protein